MSSDSTFYHTTLSDHPLVKGGAQIALFCLFWLLSGFYADLCYANTIYFYKDEHGVSRFTNTPRSHLYRPFLFLSCKTSKATSRVAKSAPKSAAKSAIVRYVEQYGKLHGIDPHLVMAVIEVESDFNSTAVSRAGAQGLMQIMPQTQQDLGLTTPFDAGDNIEAGIRYLKMLMYRFPDLSLALAAYNAGPGAVKRYKGIPPYPETRNYVYRVMANYNRRKWAQN